jgi:hypothetical protein
MGGGFGDGEMYAFLGSRVGFIALFAIAIDVFRRPCTINFIL